MKRQGLAAFLGIMLFAAGAKAAMKEAEITIQGDKRQVIVMAEVAETEADREYGLMNRTALVEGRGMLFIFDYERAVSMWMKDTKIPLDMIFMDRNGEVKKIHKNAKPYSLKVISSDFPVLYTLEVPGGFAEKSGIRSGDKMTYKIRE